MTMETTVQGQPLGLAPEVVQRAGDKLWVCWVWDWLPMALGPENEAPEGPGKDGHTPSPLSFDSPWITRRLAWQIAGVYGTKAKALRAAERWKKRR